MDAENTTDRRRNRALSTGKQRNVRFEDKNLLFEFPNLEFCSNNSSIRKEIWYSSIEIRAIKQASIDLCQQYNRQQENPEPSDDEICWRGLEHLLEGESKRRQRIRDFIAAIIQLQTERQREGSKSEATVDAIYGFARSQSRGDRRRAEKVGKSDHLAAQQEQSCFKQNRRGSAKSRRTRSVRKLIPRLRTQSNCASTELSNARYRTTGSSVERSYSSSSDGFHKRRTLMRRMSSKAASISNTLRQMGSSSKSLQSTASSTDSVSGNSFTAKHHSSLPFTVKGA